MTYHGYFNDHIILSDALIKAFNAYAVLGIYIVFFIAVLMFVVTYLWLAD